MAKLTPEQRAELEAQLAADDDDEDEGYEVQFYEKNADGHERGGTMPWKQGKKVFGSFFPDLFGDKPPAASDGKDGKPPAAVKGDGTVRKGAFGAKATG